MLTAESILERCRLSRTACRVEVLNILIGQGVAMTEGSIRGLLTTPSDRVTLYRTLKTFVEHGVLHTIALDGQDLRYALSADDPWKAPTHAHFRCTHCTKVYCVKGVSVATAQLPEGYTAHHCEVIVNGICNVCS